MRHYNALQQDESICNKLQQAAIQQAATSCNKLQQAATSCNKLQQAATSCNKLQHKSLELCHDAIARGRHYNALQQAVTHCNKP